MVDDLQVPTALGFHNLIYFFLYAIYFLLNLDFGGDLFDRPVDAGDVGAEVETRGRAIAQKAGHRKSVLHIHQQGMLTGGAAIGNDLQAATGNVRFDLGLNLFQVHSCLHSKC